MSDEPRVRPDMRVEAQPDQHAPSWMVWAALWTVYIVWGSTYLAIRITVETMPPLLAGGVRFLLAGALVYGVLLMRKGRAGTRVSRDELLGSAFVGTALLLGGNGIVMIAEQDVPSGLASLIIASTPLWVILLRTLFGEKVSRGTLIGVAVGFAGVGILVLPSDKPEGAPLSGLILLVIASACWATGSFFSKRVATPRDPFLSTAVQMLCGGAMLLLFGLLTGEAGDVAFEEFSAASMFALLYLVLVGSLLAFTAYVWVLQHAPISKVATYAYVNPVIAIFLGWLVLSEEITPFVIAGAAVIVSSVAFIINKESQPANEEIAETAPSAYIPAEPEAERAV